MCEKKSGNGGDFFDGIIAIVLFVMKWTLILSWRFFSGAYMNGRHTYNDSTWTKDATKRWRIRQGHYSWWKKKSRFKRAAWRNGVFWPCLVLSVGFAVDPWGMFFVLGMMGPGIYMLSHTRIKRIFFLPMVGHYPDGSVRQEWTLKPKYRRTLQKLSPRSLENRKVRGLALESELRGPREDGVISEIKPLPVEWHRAVQYELAEELDGQPPVEMKLLME